MTIEQNQKPLMINHQATLKNYLDKGKKSLISMIGNEAGAERLIKLALMANSKIPKIRDCTHESLLRCLIECAQLNLEPFTVLQQAYIIPYEDRKKGIVEAQFMLGYRGIVTLARRSENLKSLEAHAVYEHDTFECILGTEGTIKHIPNWRGDRGDMIAVYAVAKYKDGGLQFDVMSKSDVEKIRRKSKSPNHGPWMTDFDEMAKKTVVRRLGKYLELAPEIKRAIEKDNATDTIDVDFDFIDVDTPQIEIAPVAPVLSGSSLEAEKNLNEYRNRLHKGIKESKLDDKQKNELLNQLVLASDKKTLDDIMSIISL